MEPKRIYRAFKQEVPEESYSIPIGKAKILKEGSDLTVLTYGAMVRDTQKAVEELENETAKSVEVIDLRTISPWDKETVLSSVKKQAVLPWFKKLLSLLAYRQRYLRP